MSLYDHGGGEGAHRPGVPDRDRGHGDRDVLKARLAPGGSGSCRTSWPASQTGRAARERALRRAGVGRLQRTVHDHGMAGDPAVTGNRPGPPHRLEGPAPAGPPGPRHKPGGPRGSAPRAARERGASNGPSTITGWRAIPRSRETVPDHRIAWRVRLLPVLLARVTTREGRAGARPAPRGSAAPPTDRPRSRDGGRSR